MSKAADVNVAAGALARSGAARVAGEEFSVIFLDVGIPVLTRREHEFDVASEIVVRVVATTRDERIDEHFCELEVQSVFAGVEELVIVNAALPPVLRLLAQNVATLIE